MIARSGDGALGLFVGQQLVASTFATTYDNALGWIGMVITHPDYQRRGFAKQVIRSAMALMQARQITCVMLDATPTGQPLYEQLRFRPLYQVEIWTIDPAYVLSTAAAPMPGAIRLMLANDFSAVVALDAGMFGLARPDVLQNHLGHALVGVEGGHIVGYALNRLTSGTHTLGPLYHRSAEGAEALLRATMAAIQTRPMRLLIPGLNMPAKQIAERCGFSCTRFCTRMVYGGPVPGHMADQYAIASFATG